MDKDEQCRSILQMFEEGVRTHQQGEMPIINNKNGKDCFILDIPEDIEAKYRENFQLEDEETIMMARDTSAWNNRKTGLVITTRRIVYIPEATDAHQGRYIVNFDSYIRVTYDAHSLLFWNTEENFFAIPAKNFFKARMKSYDKDRATKNLGKLLQKIGDQVRGGKIASLEFPIIA